MIYGKLDIIRIKENLQKLRNEHDFKQEDLAIKFSVLRETISNWENVKDPKKSNALPGLHYLIDLCNLYDITLEKLLTLDSSTPDNDNSNPKEPISKNNYYIDDTNYLLKFKEHYIDEIVNPGTYDIISDDLEEFSSNLIQFSFEEIIRFVEYLKSSDFSIRDIWSNGFTILISSNEEVMDFKKKIKEYVDLIMHSEIENSKMIESVNKIMADAIEHSIASAWKELYGCEYNRSLFYWTSSKGQIMGYAQSKDECKIQASKEGHDLNNIIIRKNDFI